MAPASGLRTTDAGMSLLEVVVAMLLFGVLALAILPLAMQATTLSAGNRDSASASAFASGQLAGARSSFPDEAANSCSAVRGSARTGQPDPARTGLVADIAVAPCPATYPGAITVSVAVRDPRRPDTSATVPSERARGAIVARMASKIVVTGP